MRRIFALICVLCGIACQPTIQEPDRIPAEAIRLGEGFWTQAGIQTDFSVEPDTQQLLRLQDLDLPIQGATSLIDPAYQAFVRERDARYMDVLERSLYNDALARHRWAGSSLPDPRRYLYFQGQDTLFCNLFVAGEAHFLFLGRDCQVELETDYPWQGKLTFRWVTVPDQAFALAIRLPGWAMNQPVPDRSYEYLHRSNRSLSLKVNEDLTHPHLQKGYAVLKRQWKAGDKVELTLPMAVRRVKANVHPDSLGSRFAFEYGPLLFAGVPAEGLQIAPQASTTLQYVLEGENSDQYIVGPTWNDEMPTETKWIPYWQQNPSKPPLIWWLKRQE